MLVHSNPRSATAYEQKEWRSPFCGQGVVRAAIVLAFSLHRCKESETLALPEALEPELRNDVRLIGAGCAISP
jgi:hypothetical protein